jgi:hypothetical protein
MTGRDAVILCGDARVMADVETSRRQTNVVRHFEMLDLSDEKRQFAYYDPGVGTFSSPGAWNQKDTGILDALDKMALATVEPAVLSQLGAALATAGGVTPSWP